MSNFEFDRVILSQGDVSDVDLVFDNIQVAVVPEPGMTSLLLQPFEVETRITALIAHFEDLDRAHNAVLRANRLITLLEPIMTGCDRHETLRAESEELRNARDLLEPFFATLKLRLLEKRASNLAIERVSWTCWG